MSNYKATSKLNTEISTPFPSTFENVFYLRVREDRKAKRLYNWHAEAWISQQNKYPISGLYDCS